MASSERDNLQWDQRWTERLIIKPIPAHQEPASFTPARAGLVVVGVVFSLLGLFAIVCRVLTLLQRRRKIGGDDFAMFAAYACSTGFTAAVFTSVRWGVGLNLDDVPIYWGTRAIQAIYTDEIFYYTTIFCVKLSLMLLYLRLAAELRGWFFYASCTLLTVLVLHFTTTIAVVATQCVPIQKYWHPSMPGTCIDITAFFYSTGIFTIITDVIMIALPIPIIWRIPRKQKQKLAITAAFLVAGGGTLASCIRLYSIKIFTQSRQPMKDAAPISTWSFIEINLGILCASAAVIKPLFSKTRAPSLEGAKSRKLAHPPRFTIGHMGRCRKTISGDLKDMSRCRWSNSQSTVVTSPSTVYSKTSRLETGGELDVSPNRLSARTPQSPDTPLSRASTALPSRPGQPEAMPAFVSQEHDGTSLLSISQQQRDIEEQILQQLPGGPGKPVVGW